MMKAVAVLVMLGASILSFTAGASNSADRTYFTRGKFYSESIARYQRERVLPDHWPWEHAQQAALSGNAHTRLASKF